jgi:biopolymer transport protein ExbB/TolQ
MGPLIFVLSVIGLIYVLSLLNTWVTQARRDSSMIHALAERTGEELRNIEQQLHSFKETSTDFDLSVEADLQSLKQRVEAIEQRLDNLRH